MAYLVMADVYISVDTYGQYAHERREAGSGAHRTDRRTQRGSNFKPELSVDHTYVKNMVRTVRGGQMFTFNSLFSYEIIN